MARYPCAAFWLMSMLEEWVSSLLGLGGPGAWQSKVVLFPFLLPVSKNVGKSSCVISDWFFSIFVGVFCDYGLVSKKVKTISKLHNLKPNILKLKD